MSQADRIALATQMWNQGKTFSIKQLARLTRNNEDVLRTILHVPKKEYGVNLINTLASIPGVQLESFD